jgi:hypothetical protein
VPKGQILQAFNQTEQAVYDAGSTGTNLSTKATCEVKQLPANVSCSNNGSGHDASSELGWGYVTGANAGACDTQAIQFAEGAPPSGSVVHLQCR